MEGMDRILLSNNESGYDENTMTEEEFDIVIHTLQEKRDILWKITEKNMTSEYLGMGIMDDIRLAQIEQLSKAIAMWKNRKNG